MKSKLSGLIAATYSPFDDINQINVSSIDGMVKRLIDSGVSGLYVCGSTGEGVSMSTAERKTVAEAFIKSAAGAVPVIVQVGHNSTSDAVDLAGHAMKVGADAVSATCPSYFKIGSATQLISTMQSIAAAAENIPFYYYHIPSLTGAAIEMESFLEQAQKDIPNLVGLKYTDTKVFEFQRCLELQDGRFDCLWGCDEMLLSALSAGGKGAVGSTYNLIAPTYLKMIEAFENKDLEEARRYQSEAIEFVVQMSKFPFHSAMKYVMNKLDWNVGQCRQPQVDLSDQDKLSLDKYTQELLSKDLIK